MAGNVPHQREKDPVRIVQGVRDLFAGRSNAVGECTLTPSQATTTVTAANCGLDSQVFLFPLTANAAAELAAGGLYVSARARGSFTLTHANAVTADRTFSYAAFG
jgi:hypothetical protein